MASRDPLRLRLSVRRNGVPEVKLVWPCSRSQDLTISRLLAQIDEVLPLESGNWGLEDYVVELDDGSGGQFECLHYQQVPEVFQRDDLVTIRCLQGDDLRRRRLSGRHQITADGRHLVDGVVFGRAWVRAPRERPLPVLQPRKGPALKRGRDESEDENENETDADNAAGERAPKKTRLLALTEAVDDDQDEDEEDDDSYVDESGVDISESESEDESEDGGNSGEDEGPAQDGEDEASAKDSCHSQTSPPKPSSPKDPSSSAEPSSPPEPSSPDSPAQDSPSSPPSSSDDSSSSDSDPESEPEPEPKPKHQPKKASTSAIQGASRDHEAPEAPCSAHSKQTRGLSRTQKRNARRRRNESMRKMLAHSTNDAMSILEQRKKMFLSAESSLNSEIAARDDSDVPMNGNQPSTSDEPYSAINSHESLNGQEPNLPLNNATLGRDEPELHTNNDTLRNTHQRLEQQNLGTSPSAPYDNSHNSTESTRTRSRIDMGAGRRLVFGALGMKAPRSKADEAKIRESMMQGVIVRSNPPITQDEEADAHRDVDMTKDRDVSREMGNDMDDDVETKMSERLSKMFVMGGIECSQDEVSLSKPPFPFEQRWDPQQQGGSNRRRKRKSQVSCDDGYYEDDNNGYEHRRSKRKSQDFHEDQYGDEHGRPAHKSRKYDDGYSADTYHESSHHSQQFDDDCNADGYHKSTRQHQQPYEEHHEAHRSMNQSQHLDNHYPGLEDSGVHLDEDAGPRKSPIRDIFMNFVADENNLGLPDYEDVIAAEEAARAHTLNHQYAGEEGNDLPVYEEDFADADGGYEEPDYEGDFADADGEFEDENEHNEARDKALAPVDDFPPLPADLRSLPEVGPDDALEGMILTWKELGISKETNWQPQVMQKTGRLLTNKDERPIQVQLAVRDRETRIREYDVHTGKRVYGKFEGPDLDSEDDSEDDGMRSMPSWNDMTDVRVLQIPPNAKKRGLSDRS